MTEFLIKAILRVISILISIGLLKISLGELLSNDQIWVRIIYLVIALIGIPLIFILTNVVANLIKYSNKGEKK